MKIPKMGFSDFFVDSVQNTTESEITTAEVTESKAQSDQEILESIERKYFETEQQTESESLEMQELRVSNTNKPPIRLWRRRTRI